MPWTPDFKPDAIKMLAEILNETGLTELEYEFNGSRIRVVKQPAPITSMMMPSPTMSAPIQTEAAAARAAPTTQASGAALESSSWAPNGRAGHISDILSTTAARAASRRRGNARSTRTGASLARLRQHGWHPHP